jgi:hypothetical protein
VSPEGTCSGADGVSISQAHRRGRSSCPTERPAHGWVKTVGAGACSQRCFRSVLRWGISHRLAPPWVDGLRFAPPAAPHNRPLHALPRAPGGSSVVGLGLWLRSRRCLMRSRQQRSPNGSCWAPLRHSSWSGARQRFHDPEGWSWLRRAPHPLGPCPLVSGRCIGAPAASPTGAAPKDWGRPQPTPTA